MFLTLSINKDMFLREEVNEHIPSCITTLKLKWDNFSLTPSLEGLKTLFSKLPKHLNSLDLSDQEFDFKSGNLLEALPSIPSHIISLNLSQSLSPDLFWDVCNKAPKTITQITFSANELPQDLTAQELQTKLPHLKTVIIWEQDGNPVKNHACAFDNSPKPLHPFVKLIASAPMFYLTLGAAAIGACVLALALLSGLGIVGAAKVAVAGVAVAGLAVSFFVRKQTAPDDEHQKLSLK